MDGPDYRLSKPRMNLKNRREHLNKSDMTGQDDDREPMRPKFGKLGKKPPKDGKMSEEYMTYLE